MTFLLANCFAAILSLMQREITPENGVLYSSLPKMLSFNEFDKILELNRLNTIVVIKKKIL